jgi:hypothetical protein
MQASTYPKATGKLTQWREAADLVSIAEADIRSLKAVRGGVDGYRGICPFHAGATNPTSFHISDSGDGWRFICYSCGANGDVFAYLAERDGCSYKEAIRRFHEGQISSSPIKPTRPARPEPSRLPPPMQAVWNYHSMLDRSSSLGMTGQEWWMRRGIDESTISRFQLGYAPRCPTYVAKLPDGKNYESDSFVIPVTYRGEVKTIRHRVASPLDKGDKYRPEFAGLGAHLFNADALDVSDGDDVLIVEGEAKALYLISLGIESLMPIVSSTAGVASWLKAKGQEWYRMLHDFRRVMILFDNEPDAWAKAEMTARLFGRRGYVVRTPGKVDDWILANQEDRLTYLINALGSATPVRK